MSLSCKASDRVNEFDDSVVSSNVDDDEEFEEGSPLLNNSKLISSSDDFELDDAETLQYSRMNLLERWFSASSSTSRSTSFSPSFLILIFSEILSIFSLVWLSYIFWSIFNEFVVYSYGYCLNDLALNPVLLLLVVFFASSCLWIPPLSILFRISSPFWFLFGHFCLLARPFKSPLIRTLALSVSFVGMSTVIVAFLIQKSRPSSPTRPHLMGSALVYGYLLMLLFRFANCSVNPFYTAWWFDLCIFFVSLTFVCILVVASVVREFLTQNACSRARCLQRSLVHLPTNSSNRKTIKRNIVMENEEEDDDHIEQELVSPDVDEDDGGQEEEDNNNDDDDGGGGGGGGVDRQSDVSGAFSMLVNVPSAGIDDEEEEDAERGRRGLNKSSDDDVDDDENGSSDIFAGKKSETEWEQLFLQWRNPLFHIKRFSLFLLGSIDSVRIGVGFGSLLFLVMWLCGSASVLPRWMDVSPLGGSVFVIMVALCGVSLASLPPLSILAANPLVSFFWFLFGTLFLLLLNGWSGLVIGGGLIVLWISCLSVYVSNSIWKVQIGPTVFAGGFTFLVLMLASAFINAYQFVPVIGKVFKTGGVLKVMMLGGGGVLTGIYRWSDYLSPIHGKKGWGSHCCCCFFRTKQPRSSASLRHKRGKYSVKLIHVAVGGIGVCLVLLALIARLVVLRVSWSQNEWLRSADSQKTPANEFIVLSYNIHVGFSRDGKFDYSRIRDSIRDQLPVDLVGLQETDTVQIYTGSADVVEYLSAHLRLPIVNRGPSTKKGTYGVALLANPSHRFRNSKEAILPSGSGERAALAQSEMTHICGKESVHVLTAHWALIESAQVDEALWTIERVKDLVGGTNSTGGKTKKGESLLLNDAVIYFGDFNADPSSKPYRTLLAQQESDAYSLVDTFAYLHNNTHRATVDVGKSSQKTIDYILINAENDVLSPLRSRVCENDVRASDHLPVVSTFKCGIFER